MGPASSPSKAAAPSSSIADGKNSSLNPADHGFPRWATALVVALLAGAAMFAIVFGALAWRNRREGTGGGARGGGGQGFSRFVDAPGPTKTPV
ncbi:hypothetical protein WJX84_010927 [Apatococcus fuscideae]|uniref:Uncharacterized protein n=1 Tax=Apatococcus fuscideae TaxID=2026836 RepID=A0AAW1S2T5_9CHLO